MRLQSGRRSSWVSAPIDMILEMQGNWYRALYCISGIRSIGQESQEERLPECAIPWCPRAAPRGTRARARDGGLGSRNATQMQDPPKSPHATPFRPVSAHLPRPSDPDAPPGPGRGPETPFGAQGRHSRWAPSGETAGAQGAERNPSLLQPSPPIQNRFVACEGDVRGFQGLVVPSEVAGRHP